MKLRRAASLLAVLVATTGGQVACERPGGAEPGPVGADAKLIGPPGLGVRLEPAEPGSTTVVAIHEFGDRLQLPESRYSEPLHAGFVLVVTPQVVIFDGREVAAIADGVIAAGDVDQHHVVRLGEAMETIPDGEAKRNLVLFIDRRVKADALVDLMYTANRGAFHELQLAVRSEGAAGASRVGGLLLSPETSLVPVDDPWLGLELDATSLRVGEFYYGDVLFSHRPIWRGTVPWPGGPETTAKLGRLVQQISGVVEPADAPRSVYTHLLPGALVSSLVAARDVAAGGECDAAAALRRDRGRCLFTRWVVSAGTEPLAEEPLAERPLAPKPEPVAEGGSRSTGT